MSTANPLASASRRPRSDGITEELAATVETRLNELAIEQDLHSLDFNTMVDAAVVGDGAFKITWDVDEQTPQVTSVDPAGLWAWTRPDNVRKVQRVVQRYYLTAPEAFQLFGVGTINGAGSVPVVEDWTADRMVIEVAGQTTDDRPNPYGWIPYVIFPNQPRPHELWGDSDLVDLIDTCRELNRRLTVISSHPASVGQSDRRLGEHHRIERDPRRRRRDMGDPRRIEGLPARHAVGRRCPSAHRLHRAAVPSAVRPGGDAAHGVRRFRPERLGRCARGRNPTARPEGPASTSRLGRGLPPAKQR